MSGSSQAPKLLTRKKSADAIKATSEVAAKEVGMERLANGDHLLMLAEKSDMAAKPR